MSGRRPRSELVPNANNPRLLLRLVGFIATGIRRPGPLAEVLEVELRTVQYYTQAAQWLGLVEPEGSLRLTPRGLAMAYASPAEQHILYAQAIWRKPLTKLLIGGRDTMPPTSELAEMIQAREPAMSISTARRRATAMRGLINPAFEHRPSAREPRGTQINLPFPPSQAHAPSAPLDLRAGLAESPDVYRRLLLSLLDHGELMTGQLRALLDTMGAREAPLGAYMDMATRRGDAVRSGDRLLVSRGAAKRRDLAEDTALVALTDPLYRKYLHELDAAKPALDRVKIEQGTPEDMRLQARLAHLSHRFARWDQRIFNRRLEPGQARSACASLLLGRSLGAMPVAGASGDALVPTEGAYLDQPPGAPVVVAFPQALTLLRGGVAKINPRLRAERAAPAAVRTPSPLDRRVLVHGGLLSPGEARPRAVPDNLSLRLRVISHTPALSLLTALLLAARRGGSRCPVVTTGATLDAPRLLLPDRPNTALLDLFGRFCISQGQVIVRPPCDGLTDASLAALALDLGIAQQASGRLLLDETLFARLQEDPECRLVYDAILPLEDRLMQWLEGM